MFLKNVDFFFYFSELINESWLPACNSHCWICLELHDSIVRSCCSFSLTALLICARNTHEGMISYTYYCLVPSKRMWMHVPCKKWQCEHRGPSWQKEAKDKILIIKNSVSNLPVGVKIIKCVWVTEQCVNSSSSRHTMRCFWVHFETVYFGF